MLRLPKRSLYRIIVNRHRLTLRGRGTEAVRSAGGSTGEVIFLLLPRLTGESRDIATGAKFCPIPRITIKIITELPAGLS